MMNDDEDESIYGLIPKPPPVIVKEPLHRSSFDGVTGFCTATKKAHGTMGEPIEAFRRKPDQFLKSHSIRKDLPPRQRSVPHGNETLTKPPVPLHTQLQKSPDRPKKNFILENWKSVPNTKKLHSEQQETFYTMKKDYGKVPKYLNRVKKEFTAETAYWEEVRESQLPEDTETRVRLLSESERISVLKGLEDNLADLKKRYAALSFGQDHMSFRKKKEQMESDMAQLEEDIKTFSRQNVYVTES